ncbi:efflux transporter outer membrane subunit [uncultured Xylophilus sp.]|uniref:efflux transporter outer membrane subunit n=1 Tax=uncultured Xylophilus sp. TaxID=296832 RepID=UPI0025DF215C|nr:efflux transporter outer membrane subunit [uncultured Xylophilus sp.]
MTTTKPTPFPLALLAAALLATGCAGPHTPYAPPAATVPAQWAHGSAAQDGVVTAPRGAVAATGAWWTAFNDPALDRLVALALERNNSLAAATIRVRRAQLQAGLAAHNLRPQFTGGVSASAARPLDGGPSSRGASLNLGASYEVDLWNRLGSLRDVAQWEAVATAEDREATAQALAGTTATLYWQLALLRQRLDVGADSVAYAERTLALVRVQYRAGAVSSLEVSEAEQSVSSQRASLALLEQQQVEAANALALLFDGSLPDAAKAAPRRLPDGPLPPVAEGVPAELLARRPDVRAAELRLRSSYANIEATRASFYPALTLTGGLGSSSVALLNLLQNPVASLGMGITLPFLQQTRMDLSIRVSQATYEEAVVNFRQTLYQAFADVDNALSSRRQTAEQAAALEQSLAAARNAERLYETRYRLGAVALRVWLDAQERRRSIENSLAQVRYNELAGQATLYRVLGGGTATAG